MNRFPLTTFLLFAASLPVRGGEVYLRDGVTDGDTFYLSNVSLTDDSPALQSWVSYSLTRSACQLRIGGDNPARASSFDCELMARRHLLETWQERPALAEASDRDQDTEYLETLSLVNEAGYLGEYVAHYFGRSNWALPADLQLKAFAEWRRGHLRGHRPRTRLIGSWNYADKVGRIE
jgi:hypothetical protein